MILNSTGGLMFSKRATTLSMALLFVGMAQISNAQDNDSSMDEMMHHNMMHSTNDGRISLNLSPEMKQHQLANMRSHLEAVQTIVGLIAEGAFENASGIAHSKLGLTEEMQKMCDMFNNNEFKELAYAFHRSGDLLGDALKTGDIDKSLRALQNTLGYCVRCHGAFRQ
jgi:adenosylmethionine-8-amino-7-oxononanoate aminotransferase